MVMMVYIMPLSPWIVILEKTTLPLGNLEKTLFLCGGI